MADSIAVNTFDSTSGGINLDLDPLKVPSNVLTNTLNGTYLTFNGQDHTFLNDMGNAAVLDLKNNKVSLGDGFIPMGSCELGGILYIASYNPITGEGEIGSYPSAVPEEETQSINIDFKLEELLEKETLTLDTGLILFPGDSLVKFKSEDDTLTKVLLDKEILTIEFIIKDQKQEYAAFTNTNGEDYKITTSELYEYQLRDDVEYSFSNNLQSHLYVKYTINKDKLIPFEYYYINGALYLFYNPCSYVKYDNIVFNYSNEEDSSEYYEYEMAKFPDCKIEQYAPNIIKCTFTKDILKYLYICFKGLTINGISLSETSNNNLYYKFVLDKAEADLSTGVKFAVTDYQYYVYGNILTFKVKIEDKLNLLGEDEITINQDNLSIKNGLVSGKYYYYSDGDIIKSAIDDNNQYAIKSIDSDNNESIGTIKITYEGMSQIRPFLYTGLYNSYYDSSENLDFLTIDLELGITGELTNTYTSFSNTVGEVYQNALNSFNNDTTCTVYEEKCDITINDKYVVDLKLNVDSDYLPYNDEFTYSIPEDTTNTENNTQIGLSITTDGNEITISLTKESNISVKSSYFNDNSILTLTNITPCSEGLYNMFYPGIIFPGSHYCHRDHNVKDKYGFGLYLCPFGTYEDDGEIKYKHYYRLFEDAPINKTSDVAASSHFTTGSPIFDLPNNTEVLSDYIHTDSKSSLVYKIKDYENDLNEVIAGNTDYTFFIVGDPSDYFGTYYTKKDDLNRPGTILPNYGNDKYVIGIFPEDCLTGTDNEKSYSNCGGSTTCYFVVVCDEDFNSNGELIKNTKYIKGDFEKFTLTLIDDTTNKSYQKDFYHLISISAIAQANFSDNITIDKAYSYLYDLGFSFYIGDESDTSSGIINTGTYLYCNIESDTGRVVDLFGEIGSSKLPGKKVNTNDISGPWNLIQVSQEDSHWYSKNESCLILMRDSSGSFVIPYFHDSITRSKPAWGKIFGLGLMFACELVFPGSSVLLGATASALLVTAAVAATATATVGLTKTVCTKLTNKGFKLTRGDKVLEETEKNEGKSYTKGFKKYTVYGYDSFFSGNTIDLSIISQTDEYEYKNLTYGNKLSFWERKCHYIAESLGMFGLNYYQSSDDDITSLYFPELNSCENVRFLVETKDEDSKLTNDEIDNDTSRLHTKLGLYVSNESYTTFKDNVLTLFNNTIPKRFSNIYTTNFDLSDEILLDGYQIGCKTYSKETLEKEINNISENIKNQINCIAIVNNDDLDVNTDSSEEISTKKYFIYDSNNNYLSTDVVYDLQVDENTDIITKVMNKIATEDADITDEQLRLMEDELNLAYGWGANSEDDRVENDSYFKKAKNAIYKEKLVVSDEFLLTELNGKNILLPDSQNYTTGALSRTVSTKVYAKNKQSTTFEMKDYTSWFKIN